MCLYELLNLTRTHIIDEVTDFVRVGGARPVLRSRHEVGQHVVPEHLGPVVQTTVENTQVIVLMENTCRGYTAGCCIFYLNKTSVCPSTIHVMFPVLFLIWNILYPASFLLLISQNYNPYSSCRHCIRPKWTML